MSAEFVQALAGFFANSHGHYLKCAYAETLIHLLHPVIETATAEVNHPMWSKAVAIILQRALAMLSKPRYWSIGFSLFVVTLGVSPREVFMQHWQTCIDNIQSRFKVCPDTLDSSPVLMSGPYIPGYSHGRINSSSLDLPQPMFRVVHLDAQTTRSLGSMVPLDTEPQPAGTYNGAVRRHPALHHDPTSRLWRRLCFGIPEPIVRSSRRRDSAHGPTSTRAGGCCYPS